MPTVTLAEVRDKEEALAQFLADHLPSGKWGRNDALRQLAARALAYILKALDKDRDTILTLITRDGLLANDLDGDQNAIDAATAFLRDLAIDTGDGAFAQGSVVFYTTREGNITVPQGTKATIGTVDFTTTYIEDHSIASEDLVAVRDSRGVTVGYSFSLSFVADEPGEDGNVDVGPVTSFDPFDPYVYAGQVVRQFEGGLPSTTQEEVLTNLPDYVGAEILDNESNITTLLRRDAPYIETIDVIKSGAALMSRDRIFDENPALRFHTTGMADVYITSAIVEGILAEGSKVGGVFDLAALDPAPQHDVRFFRDLETDFILQGVLEGDILYLRDNWSGTQNQYVIEKVWKNYLMARAETPFPEEASGVTYSVGRRGTAYQDVIPGIGSSAYPETGETTSELQVPGAVLLPSIPFVFLADVSFRDPTNTYADPSTGRVHFTRRVNGTPADPATVDQLEYRIERLRPHYAGSREALVLLHVGDYTDFAGQALSLQAATIYGYATAQGQFFGEDIQERTVKGDILLRQKHGTQIPMTVRYVRDKNASAENVFEEEALLTYLARTLTQATDNEQFGLDDLSPSAREAFPGLRSLYIDAAKSIVDMPDGTVLQFDGLIYDFDTATPESRFVGDVLPSPPLLPSEWGVGRKTVQFYCTEDLITASEETTE